MCIVMVTFVHADDSSKVKISSEVSEPAVSQY